MKLFILIVLSTLLFPALVQAGIDYFSAANLRQFANHLYAQEDFPRAAGEYSRLLVAYPDSANTLDFDRLLSCYERSQQYDQALLASRFVPTDLFSQDCAWHYRKSTLFFRTTQYDSLQNWVDNIPNCSSDSLSVLLGCVALRHKNWPIARDQFSGLDADYMVGQRFLKLSQEAAHLSTKSPALAAGLATIFPGSGKLYLGRPMDALMALLTSGVTVWQAYEQFDKDGVESTTGWIYGGLGVMFYGGNIYGSYVGARIYNHHQQDIMDAKIEAHIRVFLD